MPESGASHRASAIAALGRALEGRRLVWLGIRGEDADGLADIPGFAAAFGMTAPYAARDVSLAANVTLEELNGVRMDLDDPTLDVAGTPGYPGFRRALLDILQRPSVLVPYRPTDLSTSVALSQRATVSLAGMLAPPQSRFEYKPWVELELSRWGVPALSWAYVADEDREAVARRADRETLVLRPSADSGGEGIVAVRNAADVERSWPSRDDALVAVSPFLEGATPINFSGVVFPDGTSRLHPPSVQLIGIPECTSRPFGYCGNDFGAVRGIDRNVLAAASRMGRQVAAWLHTQRYVGAFGVDALCHDGRVWFTEINARFQGSSSSSALIARRLDVPDLFLDHLLATLGLGPALPDYTLEWWAHEQPSLTHVVVHNTTGRRVRLRHADSLGGVAGSAVTQVPVSVDVDPGGTLGRLVLDRSVTQRGNEIDDEAARLVEMLRTLADPQPVKLP